MRFGVALLVIGAGAAPGCADTGGGELDPDVVADLARTPGDAVGYDWSGIYYTQVEVIECDCPENLVTDGCPSLVLDPLGSTVSVVQSDGLLMIRRADQPHLGPIDEDGSFSVGRVVTMELLGNASATWRLDGELSESESGTKLEATIRGRLKGNAIFPSGTELIEERVDCGETLELTGFR